MTGSLLSRRDVAIPPVILKGMAEEFYIRVSGDDGREVDHALWLMIRPGESVEIIQDEAAGDILWLVSKSDRVATLLQGDGVEGIQPFGEDSIASVMRDHVAWGMREVLNSRGVEGVNAVLTGMVREAVDSGLPPEFIRRLVEPLNKNIVAKTEAFESVEKRREDFENAAAFLGSIVGALAMLDRAARLQGLSGVVTAEEKKILDERMIKVQQRIMDTAAECFADFLEADMSVPENHFS